MKKRLKTFELVPISVTSIKAITSSTYHQLREELLLSRLVEYFFTYTLVLEFDTRKIQIFVPMIPIFTETGNPTIAIFQIFFEPWLG